jgi:hypothetical protein
MLYSKQNHKFRVKSAELAIDTWLKSKPCVIFGPKTKRRNRNSFLNGYLTKNIWDTVWGLLIRHENTNDASTMEGKRFRQSFRVPFPLFNNVLVPLFNEKKIFSCKSIIPIEFKILIGLRILALGDPAHAVQSIVHCIGQSTINKIFHEFCEGVTKNLFDEYVKVPEGDDLEKVIEVYRKLGFPGALGSMDCTHVKWDKCPVYLQNFCKDKNGNHSLVFQVVVDHSRRIHYVSKYKLYLNNKCEVFISFIYFVGIFLVVRLINKLWNMILILNMLCSVEWNT